jgi:hypothetical protein
MNVCIVTENNYSKNRGIRPPNFKNVFFGP